MKHYDFKLGKVLFSKLEEKQLLALLPGRHLKYVYKKEFAAQEVSNYLKMSNFTYRYNKKAALTQISEHVVFIESYELTKRG